MGIGEGGLAARIVAGLKEYSQWLWSKDLNEEEAIPVQDDGFLSDQWVVMKTVMNLTSTHLLEIPKDQSPLDLVSPSVRISRSTYPPSKSTESRKFVYLSTLKRQVHPKDPLPTSWIPTAQTASSPSPSISSQYLRVVPTLSRRNRLTGKLGCQTAQTSSESTIKETAVPNLPGTFR